MRKPVRRRPHFADAGEILARIEVLRTCATLPCRCDVAFETFDKLLYVIRLPGDLGVEIALRPPTDRFADGEPGTRDGA